MERIEEARTPRVWVRDIVCPAFPLGPAMNRADVFNKTNALNGWES
jgi:hypothetical protein